MTAALNTLERCRLAHPGEACIRIYAADMTTVIRHEDCRVWCPLLKRRIWAKKRPRPKPGRVADFNPGGS